MNANDVIEAYVHDVARHLPRRQRNDVAFELRALLHEAWEARMAETRGEPDAAAAIAFVREFGRPEDAAERYRAPLAIIDPSDGHRFLRATVTGLLVIWAVGLVEVLTTAAGPSGGVLGSLAQWWLQAVLPSLWWPGVLVVGFGLAAWSRRRWPRDNTWLPRDRQRIPGGRVAMVMAMLSIVCGLGILIDPRWLLDVTLHGHAAPAAYDALTYAEGFRHRQAPWLLAALLLNLPLFTAVVVQGRWTPRLQRLDLLLSLATCALMLWTAVGGPVFLGEASDRTVRFALVVLVLVTLAQQGIRGYRSVRPAPGTPVQGVH